jgi:predicted hydrolase (HD superfamily)
VKTGRHAEAAEHAERALEIRVTGGDAADQIADTRFVLARARWELGDRDRARSLAVEARDALTGATGAAATLRGEIEAWLAAR